MTQIGIPLLHQWPCQDVWDQVASKLQTTGFATVDLPKSLEIETARSFVTARSALHRVQVSPSSVLWIPANADSAHATGYHTAGGANSLSRYNEYREGFVISDDQLLDVPEIPEFRRDVKGLSDQLHKTANLVLDAIERHLDIAPGWFQQNLGPTITSSQFHIKRYVVPEDDSCSKDTQPRIVLPMHTDPSLISVIIHDATGRNPDGMGLECFCSVTHTWHPVPFHGHGVAVIFVGSVLSYMTGNIFPAIKHRVLHDKAYPERVAATLFVRPQLGATLCVPPSNQLRDIQKKQVTFSNWIARVSRNYSKK